jgi:xylulokinase
VEAGFACVREAVSKVDAARVRAVGVSGQQHGCVALDAAAAPLRAAKLWCDTETAPQAAALAAAWGAPVVPALTAPKVAWLLEAEPALAASIAHVVLPHDYVNHALTGVLATDAGDASGTGYWDAASRSYDLARAASISPALPSWLPPVLPPGAVLGTVTRAAADATGLPVGAAVSVGSGDNAMAALGVGAVAPGDWVVSLGTSGTLFGPLAACPPPAVVASGAVAPFCDATGGWLPLLCTLNCTLPAEEVRAAFALSHDEAAAAAASVPPGCGGVTFLPYLAGERTPDWPHAAGALTGLRASHLASPGLLYRAALEGATFGLVAGLDLLRRTGAPASSLRVVGGGAKSALWRRIVADAFGLPVLVPVETEAAALGAALQAGAAAAGAGVREFVAAAAPPLDDGARVDPDAGVAAAYAEAMARFGAVGEALYGEGGVVKR